MGSRLFNRNFIVRTLSGAVFVAVVAGAVLLSQWSFAALMVVVGAGCLREFYKLAAMAGAEPQKALGTALGVLVIAGGAMLSARPAFPLAAFIAVIPFSFAVFILEIYRQRENPLMNVAATLAGVFYVAIPLMLFSIMAYGLDTDHTAYYRPWEVLSYFAIVWANDTGAYLFGVAFGRHRLIERISPKKSWEGFFGGVVVAVGVAFLAAKLMHFGPRACIVWAGLGLVVAISGVFGDLVESMFKRAVDIKDSGSIMPGHGGWLDRFDALLLSVPFAFTYYLILAL